MRSNEAAPGETRALEGISVSLGLARERHVPRVNGGLGTATGSAASLTPSSAARTFGSNPRRAAGGVNRMGVSAVVLRTAAVIISDATVGRAAGSAASARAIRSGRSKRSRTVVSASCSGALAAGPLRNSHSLHQPRKRA